MERFEVFGDFRPKDHAEVAERRWDRLLASVLPQRRSATYKKEVLPRLKAEGE